MASAGRLSNAASAGPSGRWVVTLATKRRPEPTSAGFGEDVAWMRQPAAPGTLDGSRASKGARGWDRTQPASLPLSKKTGLGRAVVAPPLRARIQANTAV